MTTEEYGNAYQRGFTATVRFLVSRGLAYDTALDTAQSAWTKGWERRAQLRDPNLILTWTNSIALNIHRTYLRREPIMQALPEMTIPPRITSAVIDAKRILNACRPNDRAVLEGYYIEGYKVQEIAERHGWTETAVRIRLLRARRGAERNLRKPKYSKVQSIKTGKKKAIEWAAKADAPKRKVA